MKQKDRRGGRPPKKRYQSEEAVAAAAAQAELQRQQKIQKQVKSLLLQSRVKTGYNVDDQKQGTNAPRQKEKIPPINTSPLSDTYSICNHLPNTLKTLDDVLTPLDDQYISKQPRASDVHIKDDLERVRFNKQMVEWFKSRLPDSHLNFMKVLASGLYGTVVLVQDNQLVQSFIKDMMHDSEFRVYGHMLLGKEEEDDCLIFPPTNSNSSSPSHLRIKDTSMALKIEFITNVEDEMNMIKENRIHRHVVGFTKQMVMHDGSTQLFSGKSFFPEFIFAGTYTNGPCNARFRVSAMSYMDKPMTLMKYLEKDNKFDALMYAMLEKEILTMWLAGFSHADLHYMNILMVEETFGDEHMYVPKVIDFGYSVAIPQVYVQRIERNWKLNWQKESYMNIANRGLLKHVRDRFKDMKFLEFNWEGSLLANLRKLYKLSPENIVDARRKLHNTTNPAPS